MNCEEYVVAKLEQLEKENESLKRNFDVIDTLYEQVRDDLHYLLDLIEVDENKGEVSLYAWKLTNEEKYEKVKGIVKRHIPQPLVSEKNETDNQTNQDN